MTRGGEDGAARRRRVTEQLGEAVWAALELMVGAYSGAEEVQPEAVNENFDTARYFALRGDGADGETAVRETEHVSRAEAAEQMPHGEEPTAEVEARGEENGARDGQAEAAERRGWQREEVTWRERVIEKAAPRFSAYTPMAAGGESAWRTAARVSEEIERDARRYDGTLAGE